MKIIPPKKQFEDMLRGLNAAPQEIKKGLKIAMDSSLMEVHGKAVEKAPYRRGNLRRSLTWKSDTQDSRVVGAVGSNLVYARIHEFGGIVKAKGGGYLHFKGDQGWAQVKQVTIPGRHYLGQAVSSSQEAIRQRFAKIQAIKKS